MKLKQKLLNLKSQIVATAVVATLPAVSFAQDTGTTATDVDFSTLTNGISFASTITAVLGIGAAAVGLMLAFKGLQYVFKAIRTS